MNLDPHLSSGAQGAEQLHAASVEVSATSMQAIIEALAKALETDPNAIELKVGTRKAWPSSTESPELTAKALDALTNPDSKSSIRIYAEIDGTREEVFRQTKGVVISDDRNLKDNFSQAMEALKLEQPAIDAPALESPVMEQATTATMDAEPVETFSNSLTPPDFLMNRRVDEVAPEVTPEIPLTQEPTLDPALLEVGDSRNVAGLREPQELFGERLESLQTELNSAKQQLNQVLGQVQALTQHVSKLTEDPRVQAWADKAQQTFSKKADGFMTRLKSSALNLASGAWERAQQWAIESPKIDAAIDSLIQRGGADGKLELGGMAFSNVDGQRSISNAETGQTLYAGGLPR